MLEYSYFDKKQKRFVLIKQPYSYSSGSLVTAAADITCQFSVGDLTRGITVSFCDENYQELDLEGEFYLIELVVTKSARKVVMR